MSEAVLFPVSYRCNLACTYCRERLNRTEIDAWASVRALLNSSCAWVYITGGEPLLVPDIFDICDTIRAAGKKVGLTTNGNVNRDGVSRHVDRLGVSIDGPEEIHEAGRGKGTWEPAVGFLKAHVGQVETVMMTTLHEGNKAHRIEIERLGEDIGVDWLQMRDCL